MELSSNYIVIDEESKNKYKIIKILNTEDGTIYPFYNFDMQHIASTPAKHWKC
mgnify:CR=1 FL=1